MTRKMTINTLAEIDERLTSSFSSLLADIVDWKSWDRNDPDNWTAMEMNVRNLAQFLHVELTEPELTDDDTDD
jgi:hypothetical protein